MHENRKELRTQFYAKTNIEVNSEVSNNWQQYACWLENLSFEKLNNEIIKENKKLRRAFYEAIDILDLGLSSPI